MTEKNLDNQIRDALGNFEAKYDEGSWDLLSQRMAADPELASQTEAEADFDRTVKTKINNINPTYQPAHWKAMAERIQLEFSLRRRLIRYKVAEIGLVLLAIFTLVNLFPGKASFKNQVRNLKERILTKNRNFADTEIKKDIFQSATSSIVTSGSKISGENTAEIIKEIQSVNQLLAFTENSIENSNLPRERTYDLPILQKEHTSAVTPLNEIQETSSSDFGNLALINAVRNIENLGLGEINYEPKPFAGGKSKVVQRMASMLKMRVSMFGGSDYNYIETPYDPIFNLDRKNRLAHGYQAGIALSIISGDLEIETGAIYSNKEYDPGIPTEFLESLQGPPIAVSFENIQLNMLEIPLNFRFFFGDKKRWRFYGQTGGSVHMALVANYDKFPSNLDFASAGPSGSAPKLNSKEFSDGLIEGGNFEENSYFTANLGAGAERKLTPRWSLFMQPSVKAYLLPTYNNGLGPNRDRISSFSILTGARVSLW